MLDHFDKRVAASRKCAIIGGNVSLTYIGSQRNALDNYIDSGRVIRGVDDADHTGLGIGSDIFAGRKVQGQNE